MVTLRSFSCWRRGVFRRVRRDLQPVPRDIGRYVRREIRNHQQRHVVHGERHGSLLVPMRALSPPVMAGAVFIIALRLNATAALLALFVIKPMRRLYPRQRNHFGRENARRQSRLTTAFASSIKGAHRRCASFFWRFFLKCHERSYTRVARESEVSYVRAESRKCHVTALSAIRERPFPRYWI